MPARSCGVIFVTRSQWCLCGRGCVTLDACLCEWKSSLSLEIIIAVITSAPDLWFSPKNHIFYANIAKTKALTWILCLKIYQIVLNKLQSDNWNVPRTKFSTYNTVRVFVNEVVKASMKSQQMKKTKEVIKLDVAASSMCELLHCVYSG